MSTGRRHSIYAPQKTPFEISRLLDHIANQYFNYAKAIGKPVVKADICPMKEMGASEIIAYPHVNIRFHDMKVLTLLMNFLKDSKVDAERIDDHLIINKAALSATNMTSVDEGDFCFTLNETIQAWQADDMIQAVELPTFKSKH